MTLRKVRKCPQWRGLTPGHSWRTPGHGGSVAGALLLQIRHRWEPPFSVDTPRSAPNCSSSGRELLGSSRTAASFSGTSAIYVKTLAEMHIAFSRETVRVDWTRRRIRLTPAPTGWVRASCNAGPLDFREVRGISNIAGPELHGVGAEAAPLMSRVASPPSRSSSMWASVAWSSAWHWRFGRARNPAWCRTFRCLCTPCLHHWKA